MAILTDSNGVNHSLRYGTKQTGALDTNAEELSHSKRPPSLTLGPRKRPNLHTDPLIHHGRHFGRSVYAFANIQALLLAGLSADEDCPPDTLQERRELRVFRKILSMIPDFEERLMTSSEEEVMAIASMLQKGAASARSDDTKSLKGAVLDWIGPLNPPLSRNSKCDRGFNHERTGFLLCPPELDWNNPESDFLRISVESEPKATRSGNARIHGMSNVTSASLAYTFTQVRFALSSAGVFSRTDSETDSETFYTSVLDLLEDPLEQDEVRPLLLWWNQRVFPSFSMARRLAPTASALAKIKERRQALMATSALQAISVS
ncbi:hypothetical protein NMY22_g4405 [Coprinellus aureogranulatus]|nr:hypothetical protein NMY22_g4405 [Coprinellus aureogranulatus]